MLARPIITVLLAFITDQEEKKSEKVLKISLTEIFGYH